MNEDFQFWPLGQSIPDGWEFVSFLDRHHGNHAILIGRVKHELGSSILGGDEKSSTRNGAENQTGAGEVRQSEAAD